jgi:hypothetical protein
MAISSTLSSSESHLQNIPSSSFSGDQNTSDLASDTSSCSLTTSICLNQSIEAKSIPNDITASCNDLPVETKINKLSYQSS